MTASQDRVVDLVGYIYDAALRPELWPSCLGQLSDALRGAAITLHAQDVSDRIFFWSTVRTDPVCASRFERGEGYATPEKNPCIAPLRAAHAGTLLLREQVQDDAAFRMSDLYNEIIKPQKLWHWGFSALVKEPGALVPLGILRSAGAGPFAGGDLDLLNRLTVHLRRAVQTMLRLHRITAGTRAGHDVLTDLPLGVVLLDDAGRVLSANRAAEDILRAADGLRMSGGQLAAATTSDTVRLRRRIGAASQTSCADGLDAGGALTVARPSQARPLSVLVAPLRAQDGVLGVRGAAVVVFISDPEQAPCTASELLGRMYGFTPRQAELAALISEGHSLAAAAERLAMGRSTARAHLRAIFVKTGTSRQTEMTRLLLAASTNINGCRHVG